MEASGLHGRLQLAAQGGEQFVGVRRLLCSDGRFGKVHGLGEMRQAIGLRDALHGMQVTQCGTCIRYGPKALKPSEEFIAHGAYFVVDHKWTLTPRGFRAR